MTNKYADPEYKITERDWLKVQLDLYSLKYSGRENAVGFEVKWNEIICNINTSSVANMRHHKTPKEEQEKAFLNWASVQRHFVSDILCRLPTLSKLIDLNRDLIVNINDDYGKGAVTICKIRGDQIVSHMYFEDEA